MKKREGDSKPAELPVKLFKSQAGFEKWLSKYAGSAAGLWLRLAKKSSTLESLTYAEAVESALCFGWIDGQKKSYDADSWLQRFTPRTPKSIWSKINRTKALELIESGRMSDTGLAAIEIAKQNGNWERAYDSHSTAVASPDFQAALDANPRAKAFYETLGSQSRYSFLFRIQTAVKPETRKKRIDKFVGMLARHEKLS